MCDIVAIAIRYADEVWNAGRVEVADEIFAADHRYHDPMMPDLPPGAEGVRVRVGAYLGAFPDAQVTLHEVVKSGDFVIGRWTWGGTNTGELQGIPPTGKAAFIDGMHWFRFEKDRIAETWTVADTLGLMAQIGVVQLPAPAAVGA
jgi:steroid delta-isomerase-like uncharacterized protein